MSRKHKIVLGILGAIVLLDIFFFFLLCTSDSNGKNSPPQAVTEQTGQTQTFSRDGDGLYEWTGSFVLDAAGMLSAVQNEELAGYLLNLNDTTGVQIAVLTVPTTAARSNAMIIRPPFSTGMPLYCLRNVGPQSRNPNRTI